MFVQVQGREGEEGGGLGRANNWYKRKGGVVVEGRQYISTLRIPYTSGSELKLRVQKTLQDVQGPSRTKHQASTGQV